MPAVLRRIVFGEPNPGGARFAEVLRGLDESAGYCNRTIGAGHDRVTDLPWPVPLLGIDLEHPTPLLFVDRAPPAGDELGPFAWHRAELYQEAVAAAGLPPEHVEAARLSCAIYAGPDQEPWDVRAETDGVVWGVRRRGDVAYVVFRGSEVLLDFVRDLTALDPGRLAPHDRLGPMWGGFLIGMPAAWAAIAPAVAGADEVVFAGHSLGAARAGVAAAFAVLGI